jgi:hypothetical protein
VKYEGDFDKELGNALTCLGDDFRELEGSQ